MTAYQGGKKKIGKQIATILKQVEKDLGYNNLDYFEPFCGMCGVLTHMNDGNRKIVANDLNKDIILMWKAVQEGWLPEYKQLTKEEYEDLKTQESSKERGFYGVTHGYNNEFLGGYRKHNNTFDYIKLGINGLKKCNINNVIFNNETYINFKPKNKLIYCDPPYKGNLFYRNEYFSKSFDYNLFWKTMREWSKDNIVIISEYNAPEDFDCIWSKDTRYTFNCFKQNTKDGNRTFNNKKTEKLFLLIK